MLSRRSLGCAPDGKPFQLFRLTNENGMQVELMDWGATWLSCKVPVHHKFEQKERGKTAASAKEQGDFKKFFRPTREVLLGCQPSDYVKQKAYLGATIGRYANRIANGRFELNGKLYQLPTNQGAHQLHGGPRGFDQVRWRVEQATHNEVRFGYCSADGEQGFPGAVAIYVSYILLEQNTLEIRFDALASQDTPLNLTNHAYFNLQEAEQSHDVRGHFLQLNSEQFLPVDSQGIPNAPLTSVAQTSFDFRRSKRLQQDFGKEQQQLTKGYDHCFLLNHNQPAAVLTSPNCDLQLQVFTSQPAIQIYTGNYLADTPTRNGQTYADFAGIALETQAFPDTPNHPEWQHLGGISKANQVYEHWTQFRFVSG